MRCGHLGGNTSALRLSPASNNRFRRKERRPHNQALWNNPCSTAQDRSLTFAHLPCLGGNRRQLQNRKSLMAEALVGAVEAVLVPLEQASVHSGSQSARPRQFRSQPMGN